MIIFELSMPGCGSWNGRWSGEGKTHVRSRNNNQVPKEVIGRSYRYRWDDGWCVCITVTKVDCREEQKIMRRSSGFCGYDWMIDSIIKYGKILTKEEQEAIKCV